MLRAITCMRGICARESVIDSAMPSERYSLLGSPEALTNGSTAMESMGRSVRALRPMAYAMSAAHKRMSAIAPSCFAVKREPRRANVLLVVFGLKSGAVCWKTSGEETRPETSLVSNSISWRMVRRSFSSSRAVVYRFAGSFCSALSVMRSTSGARPRMECDGGSGSLVAIAIARSTKLSVMIGGRPVSIS